MFKNIIFVLLLAASLITAVSCERKENKDKNSTEQNQVNSITYVPAEKLPKKEKPVVVDIDPSEINEADDIEIDFLYEVQGYWTRPDGYEYIHDEGNMPDELIINSKAKKWKPLRDGEFSTELDCYADEQGIDLTMEDGSVIENFAFDGINLLNNDGSIAYVRIDDIPQ